MSKRALQSAINNNHGTLFVVATPIGNLSDMTFRAVDILKGADVIACEDTRITRKLVTHYAIKTPLIAYHDHNGAKVRPRIIKRLLQGHNVALVSDAGTPLISDPGHKLVNGAISSGIKVVPLPGASAVMAAVMAAGLSADGFFFAGFLPTKSAARKKRLTQLYHVCGSLVFFEASSRVAKTLCDMKAVFGKERKAVLARELTKVYETFHRGTLGELAAHYSTSGAPKGEIVLVVEPGADKEPDGQEVETMLIAALKVLSVNQAAAFVASQTGFAKRELYQKALVLAGRT